MIRILLCCGGGFSSSAIATRMKKEIKEKIDRMHTMNLFKLQPMPTFPYEPEHH